MNDTVLDFSTMLRAALGDRLSPNAFSFLDMFAEKGIMEFPFAAPGMTQRIEGREALAAYLADLANEIAFDGIGQPIIHETSDREIVILEFEGSGRGVKTGEIYAQRYVSVIRMRDGQIVHYRDYWNPLAVLQTLRGRATIAALAGGETQHG